MKWVGREGARSAWEKVRLHDLRLAASRCRRCSQKQLNWTFSRAELEHSRSILFRRLSMKADLKVQAFGSTCHGLLGLQATQPALDPHLRACTQTPLELCEADLVPRSVRALTRNPLDESITGHGSQGATTQVKDARAMTRYTATGRHGIHARHRPLEVPLSRASRPELLSR